MSLLHLYGRLWVDHVLWCVRLQSYFVLPVVVWTCIIQIFFFKQTKYLQSSVQFCFQQRKCLLMSNFVPFQAQTNQHRFWNMHKTAWFTGRYYAEPLCPCYQVPGTAVCPVSGQPHTHTCMHKLTHSLQMLSLDSLQIHQFHHRSHATQREQSTAVMPN